MFPADPNSPKVDSRIKWNLLEKICLIFSTILGGISLIYAAISFSLSKRAFEIAQIQSYQIIADSSLSVINSQLLTNRESLAQQAISVKPNVSIERTEYYIKPEEEKKKIGILITLSNSGIRKALNVTIKRIFISEQFEKIHESESLKMDLAPKIPRTVFEELVTSLNARVEYYLLVYVNYFDVDKKISNYYIFKPSKFAQTFEEVEQDTRDKIVTKFINKK